MVIFDSQDRVRIVNQSELSDYDMKDLFEGRSREVKRKGFKGEQLFTSAILSVSDPRPPRAYMLRGHGEHSPTEEGEDGYSKFQSVLAANNIELQPLELRGTNDVPAECQVLIVARPRAVLLPDELEKLDRYLTSGGRMFAAFNFVTTTNRTGLEALLRKWGVEVGINVVIDPQNSTAGADLFATQFTDHPIMRPLVVGDTPLHLLLPRTIRPIVSKNPDAPKASALVLTGPNSTTVTRFKQFYPDPSPQDERGSAPVAVAVEKGQVEGIAASRGTTRIVVVGDSKFLSNDMIDRLANRDFASFAVNWLLDRSLLFGGIGPRPIHQYQVKLSAVQLQSVRWLLILGVPGSVLALGGFVWMKRRS